MSKTKRKWIILDYNEPEALRAEDIPYNATLSIKDAVDLSSGITGIQGATGVQGLGMTGLIGSTGIEGDSGVTGPQGATGVQGLGMTGLIGSTGIEGDPGVTGPQGTTGTQGITGLDGIEGPQGDPGVTGPQGVTGMGISGGGDISGTSDYLAKFNTDETSLINSQIREDGTNVYINAAGGAVFVDASGYFNSISNGLMLGCNAGSNVDLYTAGGDVSLYSDDGTVHIKANIGVIDMTAESDILIQSSAYKYFVPMSDYTDNATAYAVFGGAGYLYRNGDNVCITHE